MSSGRKINVVMAGHVDHGKSTVLGRMLADTGALPKGKLEQVKANCERNSKPFEYAFLIDALKEEQAQGVTIDSARVFFKTGGREHIIIDAPGHIEFLRNMVTGAARAEAAILVIDAIEGVRENSRRHGFLLAMLGIRQIAVVVNKMDLVGYDEQKFREITGEYNSFLEGIDITPMAFIPASGMEGDNVVGPSGNIPWYKGKTVLDLFDMFEAEKQPVDRPFRMPVQGVYKFTESGDDRRIVAGTVVSGRVSEGDEVFFYPSGKTSRVKTIEAFNKTPQKEAVAGDATGFTLEEQVVVVRGETAIKDEDPRPHITSRIKVSLFWLSKKPMGSDRKYILKLGTQKVMARLESIERVLDTSALEETDRRDSIGRNMMAECVLKLDRQIAVDLVGDFQSTSRFVIVDDYDISGGGIVLEGLKDAHSWVRDKVILRNYKWIKSMIPHHVRTGMLRQESAVILITGEKEAPRKDLAKYLEEELFLERRLVYYLGLGNLLYGVDADIKGISDTREEHLRRLAEVAHIMLDAGVILIISAIELTKDDVDLMRIALNGTLIETVWLGDKVTTDLEVGLKLKEPLDLPEASKVIRKKLEEMGILMEKGAME